MWISKNWTKQTNDGILNTISLWNMGIYLTIRDILGLQPHKLVRTRKSDVANMRIYIQKPQFFTMNQQKPGFMARLWTSSPVSWPFWGNPNRICCGWWAPHHGSHGSHWRHGRHGRHLRHSVGPWRNHWRSWRKERVWDREGRGFCVAFSTHHPNFGVSKNGPRKMERNGRIIFDMTHQWTVRLLSSRYQVCLEQCCESMVRFLFLQTIFQGLLPSFTFRTSHNSLQILQETTFFMSQKYEVSISSPFKSPSMDSFPFNPKKFPAPSCCNWPKAIASCTSLRCQWLDQDDCTYVHM